MKLTKTLLAATFAFTAIANAQETNKFSLSGEFIPRSEWRDGFNYRYQPAAAAIPGNIEGRVGTKGHVLTQVRAALAATYKTASYTTYLKIQEVFNAGDRRQLAIGSNNNLRVQEAWADIKLNDKLTLKTGRQGIAYDDQRIMGTVGWAQQERTHDAAVFKYKSDNYSLDLGYSLNTAAGNNVFAGSPTFFSYREMGFVRAAAKYDDLSLSVLAITNNFQNPTTANKSNLVTAGIHADYTIDAVKLSLNAFLQDGERVNDGTVDGAYLASLDASYKASDKVGLGLGAELISGAEAGKTAGFFPLFGTNHKFNGFMDRFYVGNHAGGNGLIDIHASVKAKLGNGYSLLAKGLYFKEESQTKNDLGTELDLVLAKKFNGYTVKAGYSQFFESDDFPNPAGNTAGKDTQNWAFLMLIIKPKFL